MKGSLEEKSITVEPAATALSTLRPCLSDSERRSPEERMCGGNIRDYEPRKLRAIVV